MKKRLHAPLLAAFLAVGAIPVAAAQLPAALDGQELPSLAPMLEQITPAVVNIATRGRVTVQQSPLFQDPFFRHFFGMPDRMPRERATQSLGSGVIVDAEAGYVLTNNHVVAKADEISVTLADGRELTAKLVGADPETDLAVLRLEADGVALTEARFADSHELRVGDFVVAIGNPFGLGQTVTSGIVSALGRTGLGMEGYEDFIQTDASINPGNSGGALVNLRGELVGINTAILSRSGGNIGIGFAIPVHMASQVMHQLIEHGEVQRGVLGVSIQDLTPALAEAFGLEERNGVVIAQVMEGSAADKAGLKAGDVIVALDGQPVKRASAIRNRIGMLRVGEKVELSVLRDGKPRKITAAIQPRDEGQDSAAEISPRLAGAEFGETEAPRSGESQVSVRQVAPGSPAANAGLREGDIILSVNRRPVTSVADLRKAAQGSKGRLLLHVRRGNGAFFLLLQ